MVNKKAIRRAAGAAIVGAAVIECLEPRRLLAGDGLSAIYFNNAAIGGGGQKDFTGVNVTRVEPVLEFDWGAASPHASIAPDTFSARFAGQLEAPVDGEYTFYVTGDNGTRLWVDDRQLTSRWSTALNYTDTASITLKAGQRYHLVLEYFESIGNANVKLEWSAPGIDRQVIPTQYLYSGQRDFPSAVDGGYYNVKDYGAVGDGIADDTAAITAALAAAQSKFSFLYFPNGTYRVTNGFSLGSNISTAKRTILQGQNRDNAVIKLDDANPNFQTGSSPKPLISFWDGGNTGQAFRNAVYDLTLDVGKDNPNATGLRFLNNNQGGIRDVNIISRPSADGQRVGKRGLDLTGSWPGPGIVRNVFIDGFNYGIEAGHYQYSMTFEHITIANQLLIGVRNWQNIFMFRDLDSRNPTVPTYVDQGGEALLVMIDSVIASGTGTAVELRGEALIRNTVAGSGYTKVVDNLQSGLSDLTDPLVLQGEYLSIPKTGGYADRAATGLNLAIEETPDADYVDPSTWVRVDPSGSDDTQAIRNALAAASAGSGVVYFPAPHIYRITDTITISGNIKRIIGMEASMQISGTLKATPGKPVFRIANLTSDQLIFERMQSQYSESGSTGWVWIENSTDKTVVLKSLTFNGVSGTDVYRNTAAVKGKLFIEDIVSSHWFFSPGEKVWARQLNPESSARTNVTNTGATLWIMGLKTEYGETNTHTLAGGSTEVLGGLFYPASHVVDPNVPSHIIDNAKGSFTYRENGSNRYPIEVREIRGDTTVNFTTTSYGVMGLYIGYVADPVQEPHPSRDPRSSRIEAEDYDLGGAGVAYYDTSAGNSGSVYRTDDVDIQATTDTGGGYNVGWVADSEWLEYTIDVTPGQYDISLRAAAAASLAGRSVELSLNGQSLGSIAVPGTGDWQTWATFALPGVDINLTGPAVLRLTFVGGSMNLNWIEVAKVTPPPVAGDVNGDGAVDFDDLGILLGAYGGPHPTADFDADGIVDFDDLGTLLGSYTSADGPLDTAPVAGAPIDTDAGEILPTPPAPRRLTVVGPAQTIRQAYTGFVGPLPSIGLYDASDWSPAPTWPWAEVEDEDGVSEGWSPDVFSDQPIAAGLLN